MKIEYDKLYDRFYCNIFKGVSGNLKVESMVILKGLIDQAFEERDEYIKRKCEKL